MARVPSFAQYKFLRDLSSENRTTRRLTFYLESTGVRGAYSLVRLNAYVLVKRELSVRKTKTVIKV